MAPPYLLYHMVPQNLEGHTLHPLNVLERTAPHLYERHVAKYEGRESKLQKVVPPLGVLWNDVLHLRPAHPSTVRAGIEAAGASWPKSGVEWFELNPRELDMSRLNTCLYFSLVRDRRARGEHPTFGEYSEDIVATHSSLPSEVIDYYASCVAAGERPLLFHGVLHVLFRGSIDIRTCGRVRV